MLGYLATEEEKLIMDNLYKTRSRAEYVKRYVDLIIMQLEEVVGTSDLRCNIELLDDKDMEKLSSYAFYALKNVNDALSVLKTIDRMGSEHGRRSKTMERN